MSSIIPIEPYPVASESSNVGFATTILALLGFMYMMYEHFEKKFVVVRDRLQETDGRFLITEDKLATLHELEEDLRELKEAEAERKNTWEDDVTEPNKYQAIVGTATIENLHVEFRFVREKLDSFKSNRYWLLNDISANHAMIRHFLEYNFTTCHFTKKGDALVSTHQNPVAMGLDSLLHLQCGVTGSGDVSGFSRIVEVAKKMDGTFTWKRALVDSV